MLTVQKMQSLANGSEFEVIAASILKRMNSDYKGLIQTGINVNNQSIKDPVDGLVKVVKENIVNFIYFEFTIDKDLETKWLKDLSDYKGKPPKTVKDGDIVKVSKLVNKYKTEFPDSVFRICLCTNQKVSSELHHKVEKKCLRLGIQCDPIIDITKLVDFLDNEPDGHWLRKKYLNIEAERLSVELFDFLGKKTIQEYREEINYDKINIINRKASIGFNKLLLETKKPILFLTGNSGVGKSSLIYQSLEEISKTAFILRLRKKYLEEASSLNNAVYLQLKEYVPNLFRTHLQSIIKLIGKKKLIIIIEDINTAGNNCSFLIKKLLNWSSSIQSASKNKETSDEKNLIKIICPVWAKYFSDFYVSHPKLTNTTFEEFKLAQFNEEEAFSSLKLIFEHTDINLATTQIKVIAKNLNFDPFLIGIYKELVKSSKGDYLALANKALEKFIEKEISEVSIERNIPVFSIKSNLNDFAYLLLKNKKISPHYNEICNWFKGNENQLKTFHAICQRRNLLQINKDGTINYRHDRVRDALLIRGLLDAFKNPTDENEILAEPFFADLIGQAISKVSLSETTFDNLIKKNPLSFFISLQYFDGNKNEYFKKFISKIKTWLDEKLEQDSLNEILIWEIGKAIYQIDLPEVIDLTENFPNKIAIHAANFRNGKFSGGISFFGRYLNTDFEPAANHNFRDELIEIGKLKYYECYEKHLISHLKIKDLKDGQEFFRNAIVLLAGYWKSEKLSEHILECWNNSLDKKKCMTSAIWAIIQSESHNLEKHLLPLLEFWKNCPEPQLDNSNLSQIQVPIGKEEVNYRKNTKMHLSMCRWKNLKQKTIHTLIKLSRLDDEYNRLISVILLNIDSPITFRIATKRLGQNYKKAIEIQHDFFFIHYDHYIRELDPSDKFGKQLRQETVDDLCNIWSNKKNEMYQRIVAFQIWSNNIGIKELKLLQKIEYPANHRMVRIAIKRRIDLGDKSVIKLLPEYFKKEKNDFHKLEKIWCSELLEVLEIIFEELAEQHPELAKNKQIHPPYNLMGCVKKLHPLEVEEFFEKFWKYSAKTYDFFLIALLVGTPKLIKMSKMSIKNADNPKKYFKFLSLFYGFSITPDYKYITKQSLINLLEYSEYLTMKNFERIAEFCQSVDLVDWSRENILPHLGIIERTKWANQKTSIQDDLKTKFFPSQSDIKLIFSKEAKFEQLDYITDNWIQGFEKRGFKKVIFFSILKEWLIEHPTFTNFKFIAKCIEVSGKRSDLDMLNIEIFDAKSNDILNVKRETIFRVKRRTLV